MTFVKLSIFQRELYQMHCDQTIPIFKIHSANDLNVLIYKIVTSNISRNEWFLTAVAPKIATFDQLTNDHRKRQTFLFERLFDSS